MLDNPCFVLTRGPCPPGALHHAGLCPDTGLCLAPPEMLGSCVASTGESLHWAWLLLPGRLGGSGDNGCREKPLLLGVLGTMAGHRPAHSFRTDGPPLKGMVPCRKAGEEVTGTMGGIVLLPGSSALGRTEGEGLRELGQLYAVT